ncbi:MAG: zinc-ribbon domain containing protein [Bacillota bacterium]|nr:zinc-ribbon domain containing protein [Bacillota bacterium]MDW7684541.1 zinc-ribbon domain containing protein [Bacillota bacterium]
MFSDKTLECRDCKQEFVFTAGEQEFYAEKGFENEPARCPVCRSSRRQRSNGNRSERRMYTVTCSDCGVETEVPFNPTLDRPVYCRSCFQNR